MRVNFVLLVLVLGAVACKNNPSPSLSNNKDSLAIIYTKDKWSIIRPRWENARNFAVTAKIMNYSQVTSYKDFVVQVDYKSETGTLLDSKNYTIYTSIEPQKVIDFDMYIDDAAPQAASFHKTTWKLLKVTGYVQAN